MTYMGLARLSCHFLFFLKTSGCKLPKVINVFWCNGLFIEVAAMVFDRFPQTFGINRIILWKSESIWSWPFVIGAIEKEKPQN